MVKIKTLPVGKLDEVVDQIAESGTPMGGNLQVVINRKRELVPGGTIGMAKQEIKRLLQQAGQVDETFHQLAPATA